MNVAFCGHRNAYLSENEEKKLDKCLRELIKAGADTFYMGNYGKFDLLAAAKIKELKKDFPNIKSVLVLPYLNRPFNSQLYDETEFAPVEFTPKRFAIVKSNQYMVMKSDVVVAYVRYIGGAKTTMEYAERKGKTVINIAYTEKAVTASDSLKNIY